VTTPFSALRCAGRRAALRAIPAAALAALLALAAPPPAEAQTLSGRVVRGEAGVAGAPVQLHRVTRDSAGVVADGVAAADGRFRFALPPVDTTAFAVFFATALAEGVRYFGPALHPGDLPETYRIVAYDTTSAPSVADSLRVTRRDVFLMPGTRGGWEVVEVVRVDNPTRRTLVGRDGMPVFGMEVPEGITDFEAGEGGTPDGGPAAPAEMVLMGGRVLATVPITPGERDFFFRYRVGAGERTLDLPVDRFTDTLMMYVRQPGPAVEVRGLGGGGFVDAEGERYLRFSGTDLPAAAPIALRWRRTTESPLDPRMAAGALAGLILLGGAVFALRRPPPAA
jgi:hypothetical protein